MRGADVSERRADPGAGTEAQRGFYMLDRDIELARPYPERAADRPATGVVWVECQCTVNQCHHGADVLAEIRQCMGGSYQDRRVVAGHFQSSPREIKTLQTVPSRIFTPAVPNEPKSA